MRWPVARSSPAAPCRSVCRSDTTRVASAGAGVLLLESELAPESFAKTVSALAHDSERLADLGETARKRGHPNAARSIIGKALELLQV